MDAVVVVVVVDVVVDEWMFTLVHGLPLSNDCSLAPIPPRSHWVQRFGLSDSSKKSNPQLQILNWSEPYNIGLLVAHLLLPVKEGTTNYSIHLTRNRHWEKVPKEMYLKPKRISSCYLKKRKPIKIPKKKKEET